MKRPTTVAVFFALCAAVVLGALAWISVTTVRLMRAEAALRRQAAVEESIRLALWRMDSALAPVIALENARPFFEYDAFYSTDRAYAGTSLGTKGGDVLLPSPLLVEQSRWFVLHFQFTPDGQLSSPQIPDDRMLDTALAAGVAAERIETARTVLSEFAGSVDRAALERVLPEVTGEAVPSYAVVNRLPPAESVSAGDEERGQQALDAQGAPAAQQQQTGSRIARMQQSQALLNEREIQARSANIAYSQVEAIRQNPEQRGKTSEVPSGVSRGLMTPVWVGGSLLLVRRATVNGRDLIQGAVFDWPAVRERLIESVKDLLPGADLQPAGEGQAEPSRLLASVPAFLVPGEIAVEGDGGVSPIVLTLAVAWVGAVLAVAATGAVLWGAVSLSERRAAFVSAVTHELRTPLTTFRVYTEMLTENMVPDPARRSQYLETLHAEAGRLSHLVENVLAYARLENAPKAPSAERMTLGELVESTKERLSERAAQAGMTLVVEEVEAPDMCVNLDPSVVLQILYNLVDNACKYAAAAQDKRIHIETCQARGFAAIRVRDHGPGVSREFRGKLFRPFSKSAREAAHSAPGVGLGLALSRRLARRMGGDLALEEHEEGGASFVLTLPLAGAAGRA